MEILSQIRLSHADHLRRLALKKKSDNLCRLAAILDRAEPILERLEQWFLSNLHNYTPQEQLVGHESMIDTQQVEEYVIANDDQGEAIELRSGCEIVYGNANEYGE
ncbi:unnamed protein product [Angiostrongylus costaricensis]|uniref:Transposase n=1 Tax=Angiostrongylus costaricensis TaxID=334426 RepID=A0A0R3PS49_ANGCS|nr:unnamed protein product [Angiostrongylus costaricensis]